MRIPEGPPRIEISPTQGAVKVQPTRPVGGDAPRVTSGDDVRVSARGRELSLQTEGTIDTAFRRLTEDSQDPGMALFVALAMDGLWLHRLIGSPVMDETRRLAIREKALELLGNDLTPAVGKARQQA